jgi:hypothetical protein
MHASARRLALLATLSAAALTTLIASGAAPAVGRSVAHGAAGPVFTSTVFATGNAITHPTPTGPEAIADPDDITSLNGDVFVAFQNGVGPQGEASPTGNLDSTIVEFTAGGNWVDQWDVVGKCDGLTADPATGDLIATVNEDANSSLYLIDPSGGSAPVHYRFNVPLPSRGGTDAISIYDGMVLISASAPGTTGAAAPQPYYPAVYKVTFDSTTQVATVKALFYDEAQARVANVNSTYFPTRVRLALTDPDSNEDVPAYAFRFAGDFMLTSQGDEEQIFVKNAGKFNQRLSVLKLTASVDDTAWPSDSTGEILTTDNSDNTIYEVTGPFRRGEVFAAETPCDENSAPATCPGPGYPPNFLAELDPYTGVLTPVTISGPAPEAQGMLFLP